MVNLSILDRQAEADRLRPIVKAAVDRTSLRHVAEEVAVSHGTILNFLKGEVPADKTLTKLASWADGGEDPATYSAHDRLTDFLGRHGLRRVVKLATPRALTGLIAALYQAGIEEGWPEEELLELERLRRELGAETQSGGEKGSVGS